MFNPFNRSDPALDAEIARVLSEMQTNGPELDRYKQQREQLSELYALKPKAVSPDVLATVAGNFLVTFAVLHFERTAVITTKLVPFLNKKP